MKLIENIACVKTEVIRITWQERLLSWPWRPWIKFKSIKIPDPKVYKIRAKNGEEMWVGHPETIKILKEYKLKAERSGRYGSTREIF
jgi:hypothetical protein